jgi:hypothetical protein
MFATPDRVHVLVVDSVAPEDHGGDGVLFVDQAADLPYFHGSRSSTSPSMATAVKPTLPPTAEHEQMLVTRSRRAVPQLSDELRRVQRSAVVVLTPHTLAPYPDDGLRPSESGTAVTGVFNPVSSPASHPETRALLAVGLPT